MARDFFISKTLRRKTNEKNKIGGLSMAKIIAIANQKGGVGVRP